MRGIFSLSVLFKFFKWKFHLLPDKYRFCIVSKRETVTTGYRFYLVR